jgi:MFS transporter, OFA family, oxalate/formate antiporter
VFEVAQQDNKIMSRAWVILAAAIVINLTLGMNYSWSIIKKVLVTDWKWTNVDASLPYTLYSVIFSLTMVFAGRLQDKMGPRIVITLGSMLVGIGLISCSFTNTLLFLTITYAITGVGYAICFSSTMPVCLKWFPPEKKGLIMGVIVGASALASGYFSPLVNTLINLYGIHTTFVILGISVFTVIFIMAQLLTNPPQADSVHAPAINSAVQPLRPRAALADVDWHGMIKTSLFYKIWIMYFITASGGLMIIGHIVTIAQTQAHWENGFYLVILFAAFNTSGRMIAGFLSDRFGRLRILMGVFIFQTANLLLFGTYTSAALLAVGTAVTGLTYGAAFALFPLATADYYGLNNLGGNYGLVFTGWGFGALLGPLMAGWSVDTSGNYIIAYLFSAAALLGGLLLALSITPRAKTELT